MTTRLWPLLVLCAVVLAACGKKEEPVAPAAPPPAAEAETAAGVPADVAAAAAAAGSQPMPLNAAAVDVCAMLSRSDAEAVLGALSQEPKPETPQGSLLGGCQYMGQKAAMVMVSARPATEYEASVSYAAKRGASTDVPGLPGKAVQTPAGLMFQPEGKPYFIVVFPVGAQGAGDAIARDLAAKLKF